MGTGCCFIPPGSARLFYPVAPTFWCLNQVRGRMVRVLGVDRHDSKRVKGGRTVSRRRDEKREKHPRLPRLTMPQSSNVILVRIPSSHSIPASSYFALSLSFLLYFPPFSFLFSFPHFFFLHSVSYFQRDGTRSSVSILNASGSSHFASYEEKYLSAFTRNYYLVGFYFFFL